ncbi:hypothetical protein N7524_006295 [Penicillium chrysogenum]|nr:hypothetical protein N7524_006295 [Penicillium chrysogenum]
MNIIMTAYLSLTSEKDYYSSNYNNKNYNNAQGHAPNQTVMFQRATFDHQNNYYHNSKFQRSDFTPAA